MIYAKFADGGNTLPLQWRAANSASSDARGYEGMLRASRNPDDTVGRVLIPGAFQCHHRIVTHRNGVSRSVKSCATHATQILQQTVRHFIGKTAYSYC